MNELSPGLAAYGRDVAIIEQPGRATLRARRANRPGGTTDNSDNSNNVVALVVEGVAG